LFKLWPAHRAQIRRQRVEPHIEHMRLFAGNGNPPAERRSRNAQIFQPAFDETHGLIAARFRLDEFGVLLVEIEQWLLKRGELEKIVFFRDRLGWPAAVRAVVAWLCIVHESVVVNAVLPGVMPFVNVTVLTAQSK